MIVEPEFENIFENKIFNYISLDGIQNNIDTTKMPLL